MVKVQRDLTTDCAINSTQSFVQGIASISLSREVICNSNRDIATPLRRTHSKVFEKPTGV